jgi:hypothetical protein
MYFVQSVYRGLEECRARAGVDCAVAIYVLTFRTLLSTYTRAMTFENSCQERPQTN